MLEQLAPYIVPGNQIKMKYQPKSLPGTSEAQQRPRTGFVWKHNLE